MPKTAHARKAGTKKGMKSTPTKKSTGAKVKRTMPAEGKRPARREKKSTGARTPDVIRAELEAAEQKLDAYQFTDIAGMARLSDDVSALRRELDAAQLAATPSPGNPHDGLIKVLGGAEDSVPIDDVTVDNDTQLARMQGPEVERLARQIDAAGGLLHPIGVKRLDKGTAKASSPYLLIWGSRRLAARKLRGAEVITARIFPPSTTDEQISMLRTIENFGRADLTPVGRALAVAEMMDSVARTLDGDSTAEALSLGEAIGKAGSREAYVGQCLGRDELWVRDYVFVSKLGGRSRDLLGERRIDLGHARELAKLGNPEAADLIAEKAARDIHGQGGKPITWVREAVLAETRDLAKVPWRLDVAFGADAEKGCAGNACASCPFNAVTQPLLFGLSPAQVSEAADADAQLGPVGVCTNAPCFAVKLDAANKIVDKSLKHLGKEIAARGGMPLTKSQLEPWAPAEVRPEVFAREAKKHLDPETGKRLDVEESPGKATNPATPSKPSPKAAAERKHAEQLDAWAKKSAGAICKAISAKPGRLIYFTMLRNANQLASMNRGDDKTEAKARRVAGSGPIKSILKRWGKPELKDLIALEKQAGKADSHRYDVERLVPEAITLIADSLGVDLDDAPEAEPESE